jgi:cell division protein FtsB
MQVVQLLFFLSIFIALSQVVRAEQSALEQSQQIQFFEQRIRPALIQHCNECHSHETEISGGLSLDSLPGWQKGGDSGPAIIPGHPTDSLLIRAISYADSRLQMPPGGKLPTEVIEDFKEWIEDGAVDPRTTPPEAAAKVQGLSVEQARQHWAYRSRAETLTQEFSQECPPGHGVDYWIDKALHEVQISSLPAADAAQLVRRLYYDLTGLPPTSEQLNEHLKDKQPDRYQRLVDRLLASPQFGETAARFWMDVVRYADSITLRGFVLPQAWRYRDYLIDSFNQDRSFQTMIIEQVAGDLLTADNPELRARQLVATSFWAMGNTNLEQQDKAQLEMDYLDEQLDVLGSAFLAQTLSCARCHDHKFDPIPTKDYYAMAGILRSAVGLKHDNVSAWIELPLPLPPDQQQKFQQLQSQRDELAQQSQRLKQELKKSEQRPDYIAIDQLPGIVVDNSAARLVGSWTSSKTVKPILGSDYIHDNDRDKGQKSATFEPDSLPPGQYEVRLAFQAGNNRNSRVIAIVASADGETEVVIDQRKPAPDAGIWYSLGKFRFETNGQAYVLISNGQTDGHVVLDAVQFLPQGESVDSPTGDDKVLPAAPNKQIQAIQQQLQQLEKQISNLNSQLEQRPKYLTVQETGQEIDLPIHIRGSVHSLGPVAARGFLTAISTTTDVTDAPNRLGLAQWIASQQNPLTARVYVNRIWSWLMQRGIVSSQNNFGTTGSLPTHPELLDWLTERFIQSNWSTKSLIREVVLSNAYQRTLTGQSEAQTAKDPDNTLYWKGPSKRIPVESLRDAMLLISGELDLAMGGSLIRAGTKNDYNYAHQSNRRSIYQPVFRNSLPDLYEAFDFADPSSSVGQRTRSTVATQAMVMTNHPWVIARSQEAAKKYAALAEQFGLDQTLERLFWDCYGRSPTDGEWTVCREFFAANTASDGLLLEKFNQLIQVVFGTIDFRYLE